MSAPTGHRGGPTAGPTAPASGTPLGEHLQAAFHAGRRTLFDPSLRTECFILGAVCAREGRPLPGWLDCAPLRAHGPTLDRYRAYAER